MTPEEIAHQPHFTSGEDFEASVGVFIDGRYMGPAGSVPDDMLPRRCTVPECGRELAPHWSVCAMHWLDVPRAERRVLRIMFDHARKTGDQEKMAVATENIVAAIVRAQR